MAKERKNKIYQALQASKHQHQVHFGVIHHQHAPGGRTDKRQKVCLCQLSFVAAAAAPRLVALAQRASRDPREHVFDLSRRDGGRGRAARLPAAAAAAVHQELVHLPGERDRVGAG